MKRTMPTYRYFAVKNIPEERAKFLSDDLYMPSFRYDAHFKAETIADQLATASQLTLNTLELVLAGANLQQDISQKSVEDFRRHNADVFGVPDEAHAQLILRNIHILAQAEGEKYEELWQYIASAVDFDPSVEVRDLSPSDTAFKNLRDHLRQYAGWLFEAKHLSLEELLTRALHETGLTQAGWTLVLTPDALHARVAREEKTIYVGKDYRIRNDMSALRIAVHEVYGHALREGRYSLRESEGFAILLEQLLDERFSFRRTFRFLAAVLGWGLNGKPLNFRQVYEVLWRCIVIVSKHSEKKAKMIAFDECVRVFRGGRPDIAGAVYLKDAVYFEGNVTVWQTLGQKDISYEDFTAIIEGQRILP